MNRSEKGTEERKFNQCRNRFSISRFLSLAFVFVLLALFPVLTQSAEKTGQPLEKIRIAYSSLSGNMAPLWVSHERGFFRKYGLDTELVFIASGTTTAQALSSRDVALAQMAGAGVLQSHLRGADVVLIGGLVNTLTFQFMVPERDQAA